MRIFITGSHGQLGSALTRRLPAEDVVQGNLPEFDVTDLAATRQAISAADVQVVIHCAAYTDVDGAARNPERAYVVNGLGTQNVALACQACAARLVLISTNEVFDGTKDEPYYEFDTPNPINPYGRSKLAAEWYTQHLLEHFYIVRTSWLYASGGRNFVHRIQELADERGQLSVVTDEIAAPTWAEDLAEAILKLVGTERYGIYHLVNAGRASRYDFARKVLDLTKRGAVPIRPIRLDEYERASTPPRNGVLANVAGAANAITLRPWEDALGAFIRTSG